MFIHIYFNKLFKRLCESMQASLSDLPNFGGSAERSGWVGGRPVDWREREVSNSRAVEPSSRRKLKLHVPQEIHHLNLERAGDWFVISLAQPSQIIDPKTK